MLKQIMLPSRKLSGWRAFFMVSQKTAITMYEQFIELTNQIFWEGYAETLAKENPARFQLEISDFMNTYQI
jgi:hypothetical protein